MRVIAGSAGSLPLKSVEGLNTRPTTDRIKETLFNKIQYRISGCVFLDLFSGSGAIGIEALSRGARQAYFVEQEKQAVSCIRKNLEFTKLADGAKVLVCDCLKALKQLEQEDVVFDIIFMDPPYHQEHEKRMLYAMKDALFITKDSLIIVEAALDSDLSYVSDYGYEIENVKQYKSNQHVFLHSKQ